MKEICVFVLGNTTAISASPQHQYDRNGAEIVVACFTISIRYDTINRPFLLSVLHYATGPLRHCRSVLLGIYRLYISTHVYRLALHFRLGFSHLHTTRNFPTLSYSTL